MQAHKTLTVLRNAKLFLVFIAALSRVTMLWVLPRQVRGHAFGGHVPPYLCLVLADPGVCPRARLASVLVTTHNALTSVISAPAQVTRLVLLRLVQLNAQPIVNGHMT